MTLKVFIRLAGREDSDQPAPFYIDSNAKWTAVKHLLSSYYGDICPDNLDVRYWDEEDYVILSSQEELEEAYRLCEDKSYLQFYVRLMDPNGSRPSDQQAGASPPTTAIVDHGGGEPLEEIHKETVSRAEIKDHTKPENSQPSGSLKTEYVQSVKNTTSIQENDLGIVGTASVDHTEEKHADPPKKAFQRKALKSAMEGNMESSSSENVRLLDYLLTHSAQAANISGAQPNTVKDAETAEVRRHSLDAATFANLQEMMAEAGNVSYDEEHRVDQADDDDSADQDRIAVMLPGALSGANVIAIEMPEMEHHGTETAEPAEIAETGEVSTESNRDAETGFWMLPRLEADMKVELTRKLGTMVTKKERVSPSLLQQKHERRSRRMDSSQKKKKHGSDVLPEESVDEFLMKEKSSTSLASSSPLDLLSEEVSSDTPPLLPKKHERRSSKGEGKKKKHPSDLLTEDCFVRYMTKFEAQLKKDFAKEVAKKTTRNVIKNLPKLSEGSEAASNPPAIATKGSGYVHEDIICDCCDREIVGTRYICGNCPNYDLCEECEDIQPSFHNRTHVFIKLRRPCLKAGTRHGVRVPLLKRIIYEPKDEERKVDPERIQVIMERTKGQEDQTNRRLSRNNNNNEDSEGEEVNDPQTRVWEEDEHLSELPTKRVDPETIQVIMDCTKRQEEQRDRCVSRNNNNEESEEEEDLNDRQMQRVEEEEEEHLMGFPTEVLVKTTEVTCLDESSMNPGQVMGKALPLENSGSTGIESVETSKDEPRAQGDGDMEEDDLVPELVEDGFVMCPSVQSCSGEQVSTEREMSPASSIEVVDTDPRVKPQTEIVSIFQQPPVMNWTPEARTDCQNPEADDASSLSSLTDESSGDEDFVVIVPDCFDITKPLNPESLARLAVEKVEKLSSLENKLKEEPCSDIPPEAVPSFKTSRGEIVHLLSHHEMEMGRCTVSSLLGNTNQDPGHQLPSAKGLGDSSNGAAENYQSTLPVDVPCSSTSASKKEMERKSNAVDEEADAEEEESSSVQGDVPAVTEADVNQNETCTAGDHKPQTKEASNKEKASEIQNGSFDSASQDAEDSDLPDVDETDLKCPPECDEEGAAAAADADSLDPNQQLNQMVTNTFKKASNGLQQLFQTGKDIFRTLQQGEYEYKESSYVYKPSDYKLPESTWQPSSKEYVPPKSNFTLVQSEFQMPKSTYTGPQSQVSAGMGVGGEFAGPLQRIREMGYFNNERTLDLLRKYEGDVQKVVNELIEETDNDWSEQRHGSCL